MSLRGPTKKTYVAMQFWRFIRPGMVRIAARSIAGPDIVAFDDSGTNTTVIVMLNRSRDPLPVSLNLVSRHDSKIEAFFVTDQSNDFSPVHGRHHASSIAIPAESLVTLVLQAGSK